MIFSRNIQPFHFCHCSQGFLSVSHSFRIVKSCPGSLCGSQSPEAIFPEKAKSFAHLSLNMSQLDGPVCGPLRALCPSAHPLLVILKPSIFFPSPIFQNSLPNECWPIPFPAIKTGSGGRRCLENVVIIAYTHTHTYAEAPLR